MKNRLLVFLCGSLISAHAFAVEFQSNPAPGKGQTICHVQYISLVPNRTVNMDLTKSGYEVQDLEKYNLTTGTYSNAGRIAIFKATEGHVDIAFGDDNSDLEIRSNALAVVNGQDIIKLNNKDQVMAKVIFEIRNFMKVSCASNP